MCLSTVLLCSWSCDWFYLWPQDEKDAVGFTVIQNCIRIYRKTDKTVCSNKVGRDTVIEQLFLWIYPIKLSVKLPRESCQHDHCTQKYIVRYFVLYSVKPGTHWLATESCVAETGDKSPIRSTLFLVLATNRQQLEFDSLSRSTLETRLTTINSHTTSCSVRSGGYRGGGAGGMPPPPRSPRPNFAVASLENAIFI